MTTTKFLKRKLNEYSLNDCVHDSNLEYSWIEFNSFDDSDFDAIANFLDFLKECNVISIEAKGKYLMCRFL